MPANVRLADTIPVATAPAQSPDAALETLLAKVYLAGGYDFRGYRRGTVTRRLARRLHAAGAGGYSDYAAYLDANPGEYLKLAEDLTIKTSGFFRSACAFRQVARMVFPELLERRSKGKDLKVWSAACARGEEPFTVAIMLAEALGQPCPPGITVYATDISRHALDEAHAGFYSPSEVEHLPSEMRSRYFVCRGQGYQISPDIRRMVEFSRFDLTSERPPFANVDCVFCCNVLIYFQKPLQERVLNTLYGSLAKPGYLVLGEVETLPGGLSNRLECLDARARIYRRP